MKKVAFHTLGCKLNFSETSAIGRSFTDRGFRHVAFQEQPDIFVINTCSVTDQADKKCQRLVRDALKVSPHAFIAIMGCYAQLKPQEIASIPGVDAVLGAQEKFRIFDLIQHFDKGERAAVHVAPIKEASTFQHAHSVNDRTRTFLKVQDGCDYYCSFCTIPLARGRSRSDTVENIVQRAQKLVADGVQEVVLTGVNIGDYGLIEGKRQTNLLALLQALDNLKGIARFRISSIEPNLLSNEIIQFVAQSQRFMPHFHVPLQSGDNTMLKNMRRRYPRELYADRVATIKKLMPHACIGADVIVGFPGETEEHFRNTYTFLTELDVNYLHVFPYSERPNTRALSMEGVVPLEERARRAKMLRILSEKKRRSFYTRFLMTQQEVLFEHEREKDGTMRGFTPNYIRVTAPYAPERVNTLQPLQLTSINAAGLMQGKQRAQA